MPPGFVHVDLDGLWTLAGVYGFDEGEAFEKDPLFEFALPRLLDLLEKLEIRATFFIVGRDLELPSKRDAVSRILSRGHDLANHSYHHRIGLENLPEHEICNELEIAQREIEKLSGTPPLGFRSPGYDAGERVLRVCQQLGLRYDGSLLPTCWSPLLRWGAGRLRGKVAGAANPARATPDFSGQYGRGAGGASCHAPQWTRPDPSLPSVLRLPLAVSPTLKFPLHASLGMLMGERRVSRGLKRLATEGWPITYLLHTMDAADPAEYLRFLPPALARSRALNYPLSRRIDFLTGALTTLKSVTEIELTADYLARTDPLPRERSG